VTRPRGARNYVRWRRSIDEHVELRRLTFQEFAMFTWLCLKANPGTGVVRASWTTLSAQTGLPRKAVEKLARSLKGKRYVAYAPHGGWRRGLIEIAIDKFPLPGDRDTDLAAGSGPAAGPAGGPEVPAPAEKTADPPGSPEATGAADAEAGPSPGETDLFGRALRPVTERGPRREPRREPPGVPVTPETPANPRRSPPGRIKKQEREEEQEPRGVRDADAEPLGTALDREAALAATPRALRDTLELFWHRTGRMQLGSEELPWLHALEAAHTPAAIQRAIGVAVARFARRGDDPRGLTWDYIGKSLARFGTRRGPGAPTVALPAPSYPPGLTRIWP
jgi:hypothetical protein